MLKTINCYETSKTAAIYARVSTTAQMEQGFSISSQIKACTEKASELGISKNNLYIYKDDISGTLLDRPALNKMRKDIVKFNINFVICYEPDRLSRKLVHLIILTEEFNKNGKLVFVAEEYDDSPTSQMFFKLKGVIAEYERTKILERVIRGKKEKLRQGKLDKRHLYGYDYDEKNQTYKINEEEATILRRIFKLYIEGVSSNGIIKILRSENIPKMVHGKNLSWWHDSTILQLLRNDAYLGILHAWRCNGKNSKNHLKDPKEWINIPIPQIIDEKTFNLAKQKRLENKWQSTRNERRCNLLSGISYCKCGEKIYIRTTSTERYYSCKTMRKKSSLGERNPIRCKHSHCIPIIKTDTIFWRILESICKSEETIRKYINKYELKNDHDTINTTIQQINLQLKHNKKIKEQILDWYTKKLLDDTTAENKLKEISEIIYNLSMQKEELTTQLQVKDPHNIFNIFQKEKKVTLEDKRVLIRKIVDKVYIERIFESNKYKPREKLKLNIFIVFKSI